VLLSEQTDHVTHGFAVSGYVTVSLFSKMPPSATALEGPVVKWISTTFLLSLTTNLLTTGLISYRIVTTARKVSGSVDVRPYMGGLVVIIESAAIYTTGLVVFMVIYTLRTNAQVGVCLGSSLSLN
jgi:hypothetical protein